MASKADDDIFEGDCVSTSFSKLEPPIHNDGDVRRAFRELVTWAGDSLTPSRPNSRLQS
jgi:hypothetical protein